MVVQVESIWKAGLAEAHAAPLHLRLPPPAPLQTYVGLGSGDFADRAKTLTAGLIMCSAVGSLLARHTRPLSGRAQRA